jgi:hypothetical protein
MKRLKDIRGIAQETEICRNVFTDPRVAKEKFLVW